MPFDSPAGADAPASVPLAHILGALSHALDLTEGQPPGHCMRATWIGVQIGQALGLCAGDIANLYYAVLLKDLGCSSNAARIAALYGTDDLCFKRDSKQLGDDKLQALRFILDHTASGAGLLQRVRTTFNVIRNADPIVQDLIETRCERGASIARRLRFTPAVTEAIFHLDEHWDGSGRPAGLAGDAIPLFSRIALLAQVADVFRTSAGPVAASDAIDARVGTWFDPEVAAAFHTVARDPAFWTTLALPTIDNAVLSLAPGQQLVSADDGYLDDIAAAFAQVVDAKSPFTRGHSDRVAAFTDRLAEHMGVAPLVRQRLRRAALLHDVGKLGVSNAILDKPGALDEREWVSMRQHAVHSERILSRIPAFAELAEIGGSHHERLDGTGYPHRLAGSQIGFLTRIVSVADVCDALTADRPYRAAMAPDRMLAIMGADVGRAFDPACFAALKALAENERLFPAAAAAG
jgi:HD-GYP domain-containing protein (c-di-GMP phosphodiesterase class II)